MTQNPASYFLSQLQLSSSRRRLFFDAQLTTKMKQLATILKKLNIITRFYRLEGSKYRFFPSYTRYRKSSRHVRTFTRPNGRLRFTRNSLRLVNFLTPHTYYLLDTPSGLITHKEALRLGHGGLLLAIVQ